ncbi:MAG: dihydroorotate dehydrogenase electron transfer subunit [Prevotella sp.]|nr:dihydroorotate dehydrogenase electron transfer subunit [Prevotella sp.]
MKKYMLDLKVVAAQPLGNRYVLLRLTADEQLPDMVPGQFAELRVDGSPDTFLRRPISINFLDKEHNEVWFLVAVVGKGTSRLATLRRGDLLNCIIPLGNGFSIPRDADEKVLLIGGGVGVAPLLFLGEKLLETGCEPSFILGARTASDLVMLDHFKRLGRVFVTTEDDTAGEKGFVTQHSILEKERFDRICTCGPKPMMVAVARYAKSHGIDCEVSLENMMACGLGACLCCVEETKEGNICVCKQGPVLNINQLLWPI